MTHPMDLRELFEARDGLPTEDRAARKIAPFAEPRLAPPGAGLPAAELLVSRAVFALLRWTASRRAVAARFELELGRIRGLLRECDPETAGRRVLIPRLRGLEDSSRHWSVWMTLDHLRIVNHAVAPLIAELVQGRVPQGQASIAAVKPSAAAGPEVVAAFEDSCAALAAVVAASPRLATAVRFPHPWFGPLDAAGWHLLSAAHMGIHRAQIERILAPLRGRARVSPASSAAGPASSRS